jgi:Spy/CpxP family protein refolding chaperone
VTQRQSCARLGEVIQTFALAVESNYLKGPARFVAVGFMKRQLIIIRLALVGLSLCVCASLTYGRQHPARNPMARAKAGAQEKRIPEQRAEKRAQKARAAQQKAAVSPKQTAASPKPEAPEAARKPSSGPQKTATAEQRPVRQADGTHPQRAGPGQLKQANGQLKPPPSPARRAQDQLRSDREKAIKELGITSEQQGRMRTIYQEHQDEIASANRKVRQARQSFQQAIMSEQLDEGLVNKRIDDLAAAQMDQVKNQARLTAELRKVLTPDQVVKFNELQRQIRERRNKEQLNNQQSASAANPQEYEKLDLAELIASEPPDEL